MIHVFKQEKSIWNSDMDDAPVNIVQADIILRVESIICVESCGEGRCYVLLSTGREIVLKHTYDEIYGILLKSNNNTII